GSGYSASPHSSRPPSPSTWPATRRRRVRRPRRSGSPSPNPAAEQPVGLALGLLAGDAPQEIEVAPLVRLKDVLDEQLPVAAPVPGLKTRQLREPPAPLARRHVDVEP